MKKIIIILILLLLNVSSFAQPDSCWSALVLNNKAELKIRPDMSSFSQSGFYLYRNCIYDIVTKNGYSYSGRLVDIKKDSLYFTNYFNLYTAFKAGSKLDTIPLHYRELDKLKLIADRSTGNYIKYSLDNFDFVFKKDTIRHHLQSHWENIFVNDKKPYELVPHLTSQGVNLLYEESGRTYYFYGLGMTKPDRSKMDYSYDTRNIFWITPCKVEKINGIAFGFFAENIKNSPYNEKDSLTVNGLNMEIDIFSILSIMNPQLKAEYPDSLEYYTDYIKNNTDTKINGINLSLINSINETQINGINVVGLVTLIDEMNGVSITGISSFYYKLNGLSISLIYNGATIANGVQIGLINKSASLRGFQFGLWNTNGRRSLPFINWQFKESKKK